MAIKTNKKTMVVHVDPLTLNSEIEILGGNNVQTFNRETQEYEPDRTLVPLVLMPSVVAQDPHGVQNGKQALTNVEWYNGVPLTDGSNRITAGADYEVGDGTVDNFPKYALKCKKNVDPNSPFEIYAVSVFTDKRRNVEMKVENSIKVYTAYYDALNYSVKLDKPDSWTINPLQVVPDAEGYWKHTVTAQLYSGKNKVDDKNAAYWWEVFDNGAWRSINDDDLSLWIDCKDEAGNFTKTLTFDARLIDGNTAFRARAAYFETERPVSPKSEELRADTSVAVKMPKTLDVDIIQMKGARMSTKLDTLAGFEAVLSYNKDVVPNEKNHLFQIAWYGRSEKPGSKDVLIGYGRTIEFIPKDKGFEPGYLVSVYADVKLYNGHSLVTAKNGEEPEQSVVTINGVPAIAPTYV